MRFKLHKKNWKSMLVIVLIASILLNSSLQSKKTEAANPPPFFSISILAPITITGGQIPTLMVEQLPKIGIGIDVFDHTGWSQISPRTWGYPGPYPIPSYENGGYDILFIGWGWGLDVDFTGLFDSPSITPNGDNFYQYNNLEMDWAISNYTSTFSSVDRIEYAKDIQALLYEDLPQITTIYPISLYPYTEGFSGWDGLLWASSYQPMENWSVGSETEFHYATPADFEDFHIYHYESVYDAQWLRQIYNGLIERQPGTHLWGNRLATSFSSTDGLTWVIDINPNVVWADGQSLTAYDVNYSYNLLIDPDFGSPDLSYWEQYLDNTSINVINDYQVEITFLQLYTFLESNLAVDLLPEHIWGGIAPEDHEAQAITWANTDPNKLFGAGPYYLEDYNGTNGIIHLKANPYFVDWFGADPNFDDVYFEFYSNKEGALSALASGAIDMVDAQFSPRLNEINIPGVTYELISDPGTKEMAINQEHPYLGTGESCPIASEESANHIRKAISHMVPREIIVSEIYDGLAFPGVTAWCPAALGFDESLEPYTYSILSAKHHMRAAGYVYPEDNSTTNLQTSSILGMPLSLFVGSIVILNVILICFRIKKRRKGR